MYSHFKALNYKHKLTYYFQPKIKDCGNFPFDINFTVLEFFNNENSLLKER